MDRNERFRRLVFIAIITGWIGVWGVGCVEHRQVGPWDMAALSRPPATTPAPGFEADGVEAVFYEGLPWRGKPTRVFAWIGIPETRPGEQVPAMVLVHGGGGTAFESWVRLWVDRGYAAIAMDTCGHTGREGKRARHAHGGPDGWGGFDQIDEPLEDQWPYHAVADVILAHSLIRAVPEVDASRIGLTGISWGGYLTCVAAAVDDRFRFAAPVYGCGFIGRAAVWDGIFADMGPEKAALWRELWDPSQFLDNVTMPMLWVTGTNDRFFPMDALQDSYRLVQGPHTLCIRLRMIHGHGGPGEKPPEIHALADHLLKGGPPLARITGQERGEHQAWVTFESDVHVARAEVCFTRDDGPWLDRHWETVDASIDRERGRVEAIVPDDATVYYVNLIDARGCIVSSEHEERTPEG